MREEDLGCGEGDENERKSEMRVPNPSSSFYTQRQKSLPALGHLGLAFFHGGPFSVSATVN